MIVKFIEIKEDSGYYDPNVVNSNTGQKGKLIYGWTLREVFVDSTNISHFCIDEKAETNRENICSQLDLNKDASYTRVFFKHGPSTSMTIVATTEQVARRLQEK